MATTTERVRDFWDLDAPGYDRSGSHRPRTAAELACWRATLSALLPHPSVAVLDAGAGTGFLSLLLAELGHRVTAMDLSPQMLTQLRGKSTAGGYDIKVVEGDAADPPAGPFDVVVERHVLWTMPRPDRALAAWRSAAPTGRLLLLESLWGAAAAPGDAARSRARAAVARLRRAPHDHHGEYDSDLRDALPLGRGTPVDQLLDLVAASGWGAPRLHRCRDLEWAARAALPLPERLLGVPPRYAVLAGR